MGAAPKTLRRVAAAKAWVLTTGAAVIAVPAGYLAIRVVTAATNESAPFPVVGAVALLAWVPLVAALAAHRWPSGYDPYESRRWRKSDARLIDGQPAVASRAAA